MGKGRGRGRYIRSVYSYITRVRVRFAGNKDKAGFLPMSIAALGSIASPHATLWKPLAGRGYEFSVSGVRCLFHNAGWPGEENLKMFPTHQIFSCGLYDTDSTL